MATIPKAFEPFRPFRANTFAKFFLNSSSAIMIFDVFSPARLKVLLGAVQTILFWAKLSFIVAKGVNFIDGFEKFHKKLLEHNIRTSVATNADSVSLNLLNKQMNFSKFFGSHRIRIEVLKKFRIGSVLKNMDRIGSDSDRIAFFLRLM